MSDNVIYPYLKWNRTWMCFLYKIEGLEGCYCSDCVEEYKRFVFLHAKAYAYERDDDSMKITVAGVAKSDGKKTTREKELGSLENFKAGFVFRKCGSTAAVYLVGEPEIVTVDGHRISTAGGCVLVPTTKTLHDEFNRDTDFGYFEELSKQEVLGV